MTRNIPTTLCYLENPYQFELDTEILKIIVLDNTTLVETLQTPFYVKGGGQPADRGWIKIQDKIFSVSNVTYDGEGIIWHEIQTTCNSLFKVGEMVNLSIDPVVRFKHSAIHTAGELICCAIRLLGFDWEVISAIHYPQNASVDFKIELDEPQRELLKQNLQNKLKELIQKGCHVRVVKCFDKNEVIKLCGYDPSYIKDNETIRIVKVWEDTFGRPCKGTHIGNINELKDVFVRKIKNSKGHLQIRYETIT